MQSGYITAALDCRKCGGPAFPASRIVADTDGTQYGVLVLVCDKCGYQDPPNAEAIEEAKKLLKDWGDEDEHKP